MAIEIDTGAGGGGPPPTGWYTTNPNANWYVPVTPADSTGGHTGGFIVLVAGILLLIALAER